jgi:hypothetical protein
VSIIRHFLLLGVLGAMSHAVRATVSLDLDLSSTNDVEIRAIGDGGYEIETKGGDPYVFCKPVSGDYDPDTTCVLAFDYFCVNGVDSVELFYGPPIVAGNAAMGPAVPSSEGWTSYAFSVKEKQKPGSWREGYRLFRLDFGRQPGRLIQVRNIQIREPTAYERRLEREREALAQAREVFERDMQALVTQKYRSAIERVTVSADTILISVTGALEEPGLVLCEVPVYQSAVGRKEFVWQQSLVLEDGEAQVELPRFRAEGDASHDRAFSSWVVMRQMGKGLVASSHQRFADRVPAQWQLTRDRPLSKKGTTGLHGGNQFQFDDYKALGIHNCTKNIVLNGIIGVAPGKDTTPHTFNGRTYHLRQPAVRRLDRAMQDMDKLQIVVSAIILIGKNTPMTHPDCAPQGIWAMPNVVEREGWNLYAAGLDFLAQRYLRPDRKYGRITHWIMHNEVDAGWVWTNAGEKPLHTYLDLYYRSMRTAQSVVRRYGDAGDVLISLTHYWTRAHNYLCYCPRDLLDLLQKRSALEGVFDWGLAYHPYPQNLRNPRTWEDTKATFSFETTLITPRNLEVLDAYMKQSRMLFDGRPRTVVLSEQGSNSRDHSEKSYRDQAAGLVYTWLKFEKLDIIESYVHHRWLDAGPGQEGGLLLGFWTNLPDEEPRHRKKPAWEIYRKLGTGFQKEAVDVAREVIPDRYFEEIPYRGVIE